MREVQNQFNSNPYLFGFNNGVFELLTGEFRKYKFDDYLTTSCGWDFEEINYELAEHQENKEWLCRIIEDIEVDKELQLLKLQILASGLDGNSYQYINNFVGVGGNGKSFLLGMLESTLGAEYYYQAPAGMTKEISKPNSASPDLFKMMFKRWINFTEVKGMISVGVVRTLTGGGTFQGRLLHSNPISFKLNATISMEFNNPPEFDGKPQQSDYRRCLLHRFNTNFADKVKYPEKIGKTINGILWKEANPEYEKEEFRIKMRPYFFDLLAGVYRTYFGKGRGVVFTIPKSVRDETDKFIDDQNLFQKVFNDRYEKVDWTDTDIKEKSLKLKDFWDTFNYSQEFKTLRTNGQRAEYSRDNCYEWLRSNFQTKKDKNKVECMLGVVKKYKEEDNDYELEGYCETKTDTY